MPVKPSAEKDKHYPTALPQTVSLISLGCPRTLVDSEFHLGRLEQAGFHVVGEVAESQVAVINTCSFIRDAVEESIDTILQAIKLKKSGKLKAVVVVGCLVQRFGRQLLEQFPEVDGFGGVDGFGDIDALIQQALSGERPVHLRERSQLRQRQKGFPRRALSPSHYAYLKVSEGCLKGCSFCVIPKIKGPLSSRPLEDLVAEARKLVEERGVKELIVVGQDTSDYGLDLYGRGRTAELLEALSGINGVRWIRLLYLHPTGINRELIEVIRDAPTVCKYLDIPIEHADDQILRRMNRNVTQAGLREIITNLRQKIPDITLRTSVMVGFPGETEQAFEVLLAFLREVQFERLGAFQYSGEEGSASFGFAGQVPGATVQRRFKELMRVQQGIAECVNRRAIGRTLDVVIDEADSSDPSQFVGRTSGDCPEVDGCVFVRSLRPLAPGALVSVHITDSYEYDLVGEVRDSAVAPH